MEDLFQKHKRGENDKGLRWGQSLQVRRKVKMSSRKRVYEIFQAGRSQLSQLVKWCTSHQVMPGPRSQEGRADLVLWILFRHLPSPVPEEDSSANSREVRGLFFIPYLVQSQRWVFLSNEGSLTSPGSWGRGTAGTPSLRIGASVR